jgi:hypothetical protein
VTERESLAALRDRETNSAPPAEQLVI